MKRDSFEILVANAKLGTQVLLGNFTIPSEGWDR